MKPEHILRRDFLTTATLAGVGATASRLGAQKTDDASPAYTIVSPYKPAGKLGMPGLYRGRVIEVGGEESISEKTDRVNRDVLREMVARGMVALTGAASPEAAWRVFFRPGDRVGIKVNTAGAPQCVSSPELVLEVIDSLQEAGIRAEDIWLYERYTRQMDMTGYETWVPDGVHVLGCERRSGDLAHYDRDVYVEVNFFGEENPRSYLAEVVTKHVDKVVNIPNVKDHGSGGVTGCLKNIAYGSFSNIDRSHQNTYVHTKTFIGTLAGIEPLRSKTVLNIMDGLRGVWHGGPFAYIPQFLWYPKFLRLGTDPVAIDRLLLDTIENKRKAEGALSIYDRNPKNVGRAPRDAKLNYMYFREPLHVQYAASLGLGEADLKAIEHRRLHV